jgi:hypothetical protein
MFNKLSTFEPGHNKVFQKCRFVNSLLGNVG